MGEKRKKKEEEEKKIVRRAQRRWIFFFLLSFVEVRSETGVDRSRDTFWNKSIQKGLFRGKKFVISNKQLML